MSKVTDANKKIEDAVVGSYKKIEDKFVDLFLRRSDETIAEAKLRIKKEQEEHLKKQKEILNKNTKYSKSTAQI
ncbi:MAG: hypothetical protein IJO63_05040 [Bacilli bacterium]|nr:hypothetical protein [Bacilli bacterium]